MTTIIKGREVTRPSTTPLRSSILDHATVVENQEHFGLSNDEGLWPSYNCLDTLVPTELCDDPTEDKTFASAPWIPAFEFAVYGAVECNLVGLDRNDQRSELKRVFNLNEGRGVEKALLANRFVARVVDPAKPLNRQAAWAGAVDITPTPATDPGVTLPVALALLEGYAADLYAGVPTIHMPRAAASLLNERIVWEGDKAYTRNGSKVAIGGGYDDPTMLASGLWDLYATGEVYVEKAEQVDISTHELNGAIGATFGSNTGVGLVEREFRVGVDCFVAKATGTIWS